MVFYCEQACGFSRDVGLHDETYFDALVRMFEQALKLAGNMQRLNAHRSCHASTPLAIIHHICARTHRTHPHTCTIQSG